MLLRNGLAPVRALPASDEFGSATAFLVEHSETVKGFLASWQWASQALTALVASIFGVVLTGVLTDRQLLSWGWVRAASTSAAAQPRSRN